MSTVFTILIVLCASISSITPSLSKKLTNDRGPWYKKFTKTGLLTVSSTVLTILFTILQFLYNESESSKKEEIAKAEQKRRDISQRKMYDSSLVQMKNKFDISNIKVVKTFGEALGRYGLKLDSANNRLVTIVKDSSRTKVILPDSPILQILTDGIKAKDCKNGRCNYDLEVSSLDAGSTGFSLKMSLVLVDSVSKYNRIGDIYMLGASSSISKNGKCIGGFDLTENTSFEELYVIMQGSYMNIDKSKTYKIDQVFSYGKKSKTTSIVTDIGKKKIFNGLNKS